MVPPNTIMNMSPTKCNDANTETILIAGKYYNCLIDTGADVTCICSRLVECIPELRKLPIQPATHPYLASATKNEIRVKGMISFHAQVNGHAPP
jgi:hypothetical protein